MRAAHAEQLLDMRLNALEVLVRKIATTDPRLIRHDDDRDAGIVEGTNGLRGRGQQADILGSRDVVHVLNDRPIAVEKRRGARYDHARARSRMSVSSASTLAGTVRMSSTTRPSTMRETTGGSPARSRTSVWPASPATATAAEGMRAVGNDPPPTLASVSTTSHVIPRDERRSASD